MWNVYSSSLVRGNEHIHLNFSFQLLMSLQRLLLCLPLGINTSFLIEHRFNYSPPGIKLKKGGADAEGDEEEGDGRPDFEAVAGGQESLDKVLEASGFTRKDQETLEQVSNLIIL